MFFSLIKGNRYIFIGEVNLSKIEFAPFSKGDCSRGKNLHLLGANSLFLEQMPFRSGLVCRKANRINKKIFPLLKMAGNLPDVSLHLNICHVPRAQLFKT